MSAGPATMRLRAAARAGALALSAVVLAATSVDRPCLEQDDSAEFAAATGCGPAGVVTLRTERTHPGSRACDDVIVHADGGPAVGLPARGGISYTRAGKADYPGDLLLRASITLEGPVGLPDAVPATTVTRACRTERTARNVLSIACEGPDPEAACTGTLSIRPPVTP